MDVSTPVLPELKKEIYGHVQFCAKQKLARHSSFNSEQASERTQRKVNSEPSSPYRQKQGICLYLPTASISHHVMVALPVQWCFSELTVGSAWDGEFTGYTHGPQPEIDSRWPWGLKITWFAMVDLFDASQQFTRFIKQYLLCFVFLLIFNETYIHHLELASGHVSLWIKTRMDLR